MITNYDYYITKYLGEEIQSETEFGRLAKIAERYIRRFTAERTLEVTDDLQDAVCAVCEILQQNAGDVSAENVDGYSVTYQDKTLAKKIEEILRLYLPAALLYRGV